MYPQRHRVKESELRRVPTSVVWCSVRFMDSDVSDDGTPTPLPFL